MAKANKIDFFLLAVVFFYYFCSKIAEFYNSTKTLM